MEIMFAEWKRLQKQLKEIKAKEMMLRKEICFDILKGLPQPCKELCTIGEDEVEAKIAVVHKLDEPLLEQMHKELTQEEKNTLERKPSLLVREYKKLDGEYLIHQAVEIKPSAPTLKIIT